MVCTRVNRIQAYVARILPHVGMHSYITGMLLVCTVMLLVYNRMLLVCTRMDFCGVLVPIAQTIQQMLRPRNPSESLAKKNWKGWLQGIDKT